MKLTERTIRGIYDAVKLYVIVLSATSINVLILAAAYRLVHL